MKRSIDRLLTSHTGSLPRPPELVALHIRRARGEAVDDEMRRIGPTAVRDVVARQAGIGLDVINDGEQQREGFFQYVQRRMSGFGGGWSRPPVADFIRYPLYLDMVRKQWEDTAGISRSRMPMAVGEVHYGDTHYIDAECADLKAAVDGAPDVTELFMNAPSPGIIASAMKNEHYDSDRAYLAALAEALRIDRPDETDVAYGTVSHGGSRAVFVYAALATSPNELPARLRFAGLDPERDYRVALGLPLDAHAAALRGVPPWLRAVAEAGSDGGVVVPGRLLTSAGLPVPGLHPEHALLLTLTAV